MGGAFPGTFPWPLRFAALAQAALLSGTAIVVLSAAGLVLTAWATRMRRLMWLIVVLAAISLVLNLITPSAGERAIWAPVALLLLTTSIVVAVQSPDGKNR
jgi:hypothetical protein